MFKLKGGLLAEFRCSGVCGFSFYFKICGLTGFGCIAVFGVHRVWNF